MTTKKETSEIKNGLPTLQWLSIMVTLIASVIGGYYSLEKRISMIEKSKDEEKAAFVELQKIVLSGMDKRIVLEGKVTAITDAIVNWKQENKEDHTDIKESLQRLYDEKRVSAMNKDQSTIQ